MGAIQIEKVVKRYGPQVVVHGIDLDIADGEFVVLVGPSGCGKSTTLRMLAGLETLDGGAIRIGGRVVNDLEPKERDIAMVFQNYAIYPHMTVARNIAFGLHTAKLSKAEKDAKVAEAGRILGLEALLERKPSQLSGGQRQRVAIGRAMVRSPAAFLFDEPLSNLDAQLRSQMRLEIKKLHQRLGTTIVYVTHDQVEAMTMADRIVVMRGGSILQVGRPMDLYERPADVFTARFIGSPTMNMLPCQASATNLILTTGTGRIDYSGAPLANGAVLLGIRPQDLRMLAPAEQADLVVEGVVSATEPLGSETFVHLDLDGTPLMGSGPAKLPAVVGDRVRLGVARDSLHLFDATTEQRIEPEAAH